MEDFGSQDLVPEPEIAFAPTSTPIRVESNKQQRASTASFQELPDVEQTSAANRQTATSRDQFDPFAVPPNFAFAEQHQSSRRVLQLQAKFDEDNESLDDYCPCCNYPIQGDQFPLLCDTKRLNELGEGFPLYYDMIKYLIGMMIFTFLLSGVYCLTKNYAAERIVDHDPSLGGHLILRGTLANYGNTATPSVLEPWLNVLSMWLLLILYYFLTTRHKRLKRQLDMSAITPSDYTVMLTNMPETFNESDLKEFLEVNGRPDGIRCEVVKMNFVYRASALVETRKKRESVKEKLLMAQKLQVSPLEPPLLFLHPARRSVDYYQSHLQSLTDSLAVLEQGNHKEFTKVAFITFNQDEEAKCVIKFLDRPEINSTWEIIRHVLCPSRSKVTKNVFGGSKIVTKRAPEPSDIIWENIGVPKKTVYTRRALTWVATFIILGASILAIFFSTTVKSTLRKVYSPSDYSVSDTIAYNVLSFLPSLIVVFINLVLTSIIRATSSLEKHVTITSYNTSVALKQTLAMFLNTAVVSFVLHWGDFYSPKGLAAEMYNIMISNAVAQPVVYWINFPYLIQRYIRRKAVRKDRRCLMTQRRAQKLFEGPPLDMPQRYATLLKTYLLTVVYAPMMPFAYVFGIIAMIIQYWVDKYMLLRVHCRPVRLSHDLDSVMLQVIPIGAVLYACGNWIFFVDLSAEFYVPGVVGVLTTFVYYLIPLKKISKVISLKKSARVKASVNTLSESEKKYEDAAVDFVDDYDRLNPLTQEQGIQYWVNLVKNKKGPEEAEQLQKTLNDGDAKRRFDALKQKHSALGKGLSMLFGKTAAAKIVLPTNLPVNELRTTAHSSVPSTNPFAKLLTLAGKTGPTPPISQM